MSSKRQTEDEVQQDTAKKAKKPIRIWIDGCFDLMHFGHANAMRQARSMGDVLVVGVHSDAEIAKHKGPTVMNERERYEAVRACKWVDEVVEDAPYITQLDVIDKYNIDYVVHGDDISSTADGTDAYHLVKQAGRYREFKRTEGVSTTELVGRMLLCSREHLVQSTGNSGLGGIDAKQLDAFSSDGSNATTRINHYLPTSQRIVQFSDGREPKPDDVVVYVDGTFDLFHVGHIEFLKRARELGTYLLVGIHDDKTVNRIKGGNFPIMNLHERVLGVLSCRYVDEVIIGAPYSVTKEVLEKVYKVHIVAHGGDEALPDIDGKDPYELPKKLGIYRRVETPSSSITTQSIIDRIIEHRKMYEERNRRKAEKAEAEAELKRLESSGN